MTEDLRSFVGSEITSGMGGIAAGRFLTEARRFLAEAGVPFAVVAAMTDYQFMPANCHPTDLIA